MNCKNVFPFILVTFEGYFIHCRSIAVINGSLALNFTCTCSYLQSPPLLVKRELSFDLFYLVVSFFQTDDSDGQLLPSSSDEMSHDQSHDSSDSFIKTTSSADLPVITTTPRKISKYDGEFKFILHVVLAKCTCNVMYMH